MGSSGQNRPDPSVYHSNCGPLYLDCSRIFSKIGIMNFCDGISYLGHSGTVIIVLYSCFLEKTSQGLQFYLPSGQSAE